MREILMIDDKFSRWQPILEKSALKYDFNLTNSPSVEDGLKKLGLYPGSIEAVILGLTFADDKMQGLEGLLKIKEMDECMPVVILTAKTDDFQLVSECIRLGAHDYFAKPTINPGRLFLQIESAIQQSNQKRKLLNLTNSASNKSAPLPFLFFTSKSDNPDSGYFAFRLNAVASASFENKYETEYLSHLAYEWHNNLLNSLTFYDSGLTLRLRYLSDPGDEYIRPVLVIEFKSQAYDEAMLRYREIQAEFNLIMQSKKEPGRTIYSFSPVTDEKELKNILVPFIPESFVEFSPEIIPCTSFHRSGIGFRPATKAVAEDEGTLPYLPKPNLRTDDFCEQLFLQKKDAMVEIVVSPVKLKREEIDWLRDLEEDIRLYNLTDIEKEKVTQSITAYLNAPSKCFKVEVFAAQKSKRIGENLLSAITTSFFGHESNVKTTQISFSSEDILKVRGKDNERPGWSHLYPLSTVAGIFKFPYPSSAAISGIRYLQPAFGYIPENMNEKGVLAGKIKSNGIEMPVKISVEDLRKHLYMLGQTGTGKTTVLYSMIMDRINAGNGVCVIDPHGDLHKKLLNNIPDKRKKDIILIEPGNIKNKVRINLLEYNKENPQEKSFLIDDLFNFFRQEYESMTMGPIFELFMKNALLLLMDDADNLGSIGDIASVFQNTSFREELLSKCKDREVVDFWRETALKANGEMSLMNVSPYIVSKLNQLLINEYIKPIVVTQKSNINFREIIDNNKILLVSLPKGKIGKIGVNILGTVVLSRIINAAFSRENIPEEKRNDFTLFVDEFQNFMAQSVMYAMSEARKYRLSLVLANQTLGQLSGQMMQSVLGNVGSTIFFRPGINDVDFIMPYFTPYLSRENILTLPNYKCVGRLQINNTLSLPFVFDTIPMN